MGISPAPFFTWRGYVDDETQLVGTVSAVFRTKNFSFITCEGVEYFAHESGFVTDFIDTQPGDKVTFTPLKTNKGARAVAVRRIN